MGYVCLVEFKVMSMSGLIMVLGKPWFNDADPHMSWKMNTMHIRTSHEAFTIAPTGSTLEFNLMSLQLINALSDREDRLMCMSIYGVNKEEEPPPGVQTELQSHEGHIYSIWIRDAKFAPDKSVDAPIPKAAQSTAKETCANALAE
jgi:hypothetical protein